MARPGSVVAAAVALLAALAAPVGAQGLRTLHVDAFSMRADRSRIPVGSIFHVAIRVHVREHITQLDELVIPDIGTMEPMGDERTVSHASGGTDVVETLTLAPTQPGPFTFRPAYLDAIDGRTGRPSRFSSNLLRVVVGATPIGSPVDAAVAALQGVLLVVGVLVAFGVALVVVFAVVRVVRARRRATVTIAAPVPPTPQPPPAPVRTPRDEVAAALRRYRTSPANGALHDLRGALVVAAGAPAGGTLRDALAVARDGSLRAALQAAERTAFGPAAARDTASADLVEATQRWLQ
jgi:hypothetical protein